MCIDAEEREKILASDEEKVLVDASAGTGKTTIMVEKALQYIKRSEFKHYQKVAMITFTRFATQQIRDKIIEFRASDIERNKLEVSTNNGFVLAEIIRPFLREAYGKEYPQGKEFRQEFSGEYKFTCRKFGMKQLRDHWVMGSYTEAKKDFTFQLALSILKKSKNARKYIKVKYPAMFLDEYQDSGPEMHEFFMYLKDELNISLFIVGDIKQAIFGFRGAHPDIFKSLNDKEGFTRFELIHNFRSNLGIIKYTSYFLGETITQTDIEEGVTLNKAVDWSKLISKEMQRIEDDASIVYLVDSPRNYPEIIAELERNYGFIYMEDPPLTTEYPNYDVLYPLLSFYHDENNYNRFDLLNEIGVQALQRNQSTLDNIEKLLKSEQIEEVFNQYSNLVERQFSIREIESFQESMEEKWKVQFCKEKPRKQIMTIHKSKGLDFDYVFVDAKTFYFRGDFREQNHYVAITRAKRGLYINMNYSKYGECLKGILS